MRLMRVKQNYLNLIKNGQETLEIRADYASTRTIQPRENIKLASHTETIVIRVEDIRNVRNVQP